MNIASVHNLSITNPRKMSEATYLKHMLRELRKEQRKLAALLRKREQHKCLSMAVADLEQQIRMGDTRPTYLR